MKVTLATEQEIRDMVGTSCPNCGHGWDSCECVTTVELVVVDVIMLEQHLINEIFETEAISQASNFSDRLTALMYAARSINPRIGQ